MSLEPPPTVDIDASLARKPCIVFMPMLPGYEAIRVAVARAVESAGCELRRLEVLLTDPEWQLWLVESVPVASFALVDVTDHNPFVMYELGLAHSRRLPAILIMNSRNPRVTATVLGSPFLPYDAREALESAEDALVRWMTLLADVSSVPFATSRGEHDVGYGLSRVLLEQFRADSGLLVDAVEREEYVTRWRVAEGRGDGRRITTNLQWMALQELPRVIRDSGETALMKQVVAWSLSSCPDLLALAKTST